MTVSVVMGVGTVMVGIVEVVATVVALVGVFAMGGFAGVVFVPGMVDVVAALVVEMFRATGAGTGVIGVVGFFTEVGGDAVCTGRLSNGLGR